MSAKEPRLRGPCDKDAPIENHLGEREMARRATGVSWGTIASLGGVLHDIIRHNQGRPHLAIIQKAENAIERHLPALVGRTEQLVRRAAYAKELSNDWLKEIERFITEHIKAFLTTKYASADAWYYEDKGQIGPLTLEELKATLSTFPNAKAGSLFVRCSSFANWKQAKDVPELNAEGLD